MNVAVNRRPWKDEDSGSRHPLWLAVVGGTQQRHLSKGVEPVKWKRML